MISNLIKKNVPEWIEAGVVVLTLIVGAIVSAGITYYKVDAMTTDVRDIKNTMLLIPVLVNRVDNLEGRVEAIDEDVNKLEERMFYLKEGANAKEGTI